MLMVQVLYLFLIVWNFWEIKSQPGTPNTCSLLQSVTLEEQRAWIKIECLRQTPPAEIARQLRSCLGGQAFSERHIYRLCQEFTAGDRVETCQATRDGRPPTATSVAMKVRLKLLMDELDGARTEELADRLETSQSSVQRMLHEMGYRYIIGRWIPHELTCYQKAQRVITARMNRRMYRDDPTVLNRIIAIDETYLSSYMPLTDVQARGWYGPDDEP